MLVYFPFVARSVVHSEDHRGRVLQRCGVRYRAIVVRLCACVCPCG